jgi:lysophospholipase L1-like esterase
LTRASLAALGLALGLLLAAPSARSSGPTRYVVGAIGDSLTDEKVGGGKYLAFLREKCPQSTFIAKGKGGEMVNQMRKRFARVLFGPAQPAYTHILVLGGVNDLYSDETAGRTPAKVESDLTTMYQIARDHGARVIAVTVAPWGGFSRYWTEKRQRDTDTLNDWIRAQPAAGKAEHVVDAATLLAGDPPTKLCAGCGQKDGLHWTRAGHEKLADALFSQIFADCQ